MVVCLSEWEKSEPAPLPVNGSSAAKFRSSKLTARRAILPFGYVVLPLRMFLGFTFGFAGIQKLSNPQFFNSQNPVSIQAQFKVFSLTSPLHSLLAPLSKQALLLGIIIAIAEVAVGLGVLFGVFTRVASAGGLFISTMLFLTVSYHVKPFYTGSDVVFIFAWLPLVARGDAGVLSLQAYLRRRALRADSTRFVELDFTSMASICKHKLGENCNFLAKGAKCDVQLCPILRTVTAADLTAVERFDDYQLQRRKFVASSAAAAVVGGIGFVGSAFAVIVGRMFAPKFTAQAPVSFGTSLTGAKPSVTSSHDATAPTTSTTSLDPRATATTAANSPSTSVAGAKPAGVIIGPATAVPLGKVASFTDPKTGGPAYILHPTASGFVAYSAICPHAGCTVMYEANERFVCPCHGSQFNATTGAVLQGPASTGLSSISIVEGSDGQLYVQG